MPQINPDEPFDIKWRQGQLCWAGSNNPAVRIVNGVNGTKQQQQQHLQPQQQQQEQCTKLRNHCYQWRIQTLS